MPLMLLLWGQQGRCWKLGAGSRHGHPCAHPAASRGGNCPERTQFGGRPPGGVRGRRAPQAVRGAHRPAAAGGLAKPYNPKYLQMVQGPMQSCARQVAAWDPVLKFVPLRHTLRKYQDVMTIRLPARSALRQASADHTPKVHCCRDTDEPAIQ